MVHANDSIPVVVPFGNVNSLLGNEGSMYIIDEALLNWSAKLPGGLYNGVLRGSQCSNWELAPCVIETSVIC